MSLEASIGSIQDICLASPVEESIITPTRKLTNMSSEETCEGQVQGLYTRELVENLKTQCLCLYPNTVMKQNHGWKTHCPQECTPRQKKGVEREQEESEHTGMN